MRAELDALRSRAYGPAPDIADDPAAMRRLHELEDLFRQPASPDRAPVDTDGPAPPPGSPPSRAQTEPAAPTGAASARAAHHTPALPADEPPARRRRDVGVRRPRRVRPSALTWVLWAGSIAAAAAVGAVTTYALVKITPVTVFQGAEQIATLEPDSTQKVPPGFFGAGASSASYEFSGLTLFETSNGLNGATGDCFAVVLTADVPEDPEGVQNGYSASGPIYSACRAGSFPATISILVDSSAPPELRAKYPDAAVHFIKDGPRIGVFLDAPPEA